MSGANPSTISQRLYLACTKPRVLRPVFALLRRFAPVFRFRNYVVVSRYLDVVDVLARDGDCTISQLNGPNIDALDGPFVLGLDRGPQYDREAEMLRAVLLPKDIERIRSIVKEEAMRQIAAAWSARRIDVVNDFARTVAVRVVGRYFGVPICDERQMATWLRDIFWAIFENVTGNASVRERAARSSAALRAYLNAVIARHKAATPGDLPAGVLGRLIALQGDDRPWLDDRTVRRNITGLIAAMVDNSAVFVTHGLAELLRRPEQLALAREAALAGDSETVRRYLYEAARFDPPAPLLARYVPRATVLAPGTPRERRIEAGTTIVIGNISAMFDPDGFDDPNDFDIDHDAAVLHFGFGLHRCMGARINGVQLAELASALLCLSNIRRPSGSAGTIDYEGPFPNRFVLEFG
ncbi:MAG: hypothetical protein NVS3B16_21970 [Vulcanimicrobiaceae bacterium]